MKKSIFITGMFVANLLTPATAEVITNTNLSVNFESANIIGTGRNINMHRVPVVNIDTGQTTFYDAAFKFTFNPNSGFQFEQISSVGISPPLSSSNLIPGKYSGDQDPRFIYSLSEPSSLSDGRLFYTLTSTKEGGDLFTAQIVTGDVNNHPDIGSREIIDSLSSTYTYGIVTNLSTNSSASSFFGRGADDKWLVNHLIGLRQTGSTLSVTLFSQGVDSDGNSQDFSSQRDGAILTKVVE